MEIRKNTALDQGQITDNQLMLAVKAGDLDKAGILFERYKNILYRFFYNMHHDRMTSEDLVQNVFLRIMKYRHNFHGHGQFKHWVFRIAKHVHADHYRKTTRRAESDMETWQDTLSIAPAQQKSLELREDIQLLRKALQKLDVRKREALILSRLHGMLYKEIAEITGTSEGAVKVRIFRGLRELKTLYERLREQ